ncbi:hypothetical protein, partial [Bacillus altitudinis]|uniref:hypothetical protein n=1 Tax=Bacillus altitudinis TaxID=293387 RepID=UPI001C9302E2
GDNEEVGLGNGGGVLVVELVTEGLSLECGRGEWFEEAGGEKRNGFWGFGGWVVGESGMIDVVVFVDEGLWYMVE